MTCYIDSSVFIESLFSRKKHAVSLDIYGEIYSSRLLQTECARVMIREILAKNIPESSYAQMKNVLMKAISGISLIHVDENILSTAETPFPMHLATLDSIHLATALNLKKSLGDEEFFFLTYDEKLGKAAQVMGLQVLGI